jgi:hypothetical protein
VEDNEAATAVAKAERQALHDKLEQLANRHVSTTRVAEMLQRLDQVWAHLTVENRARMLRAAIVDVRLHRQDSQFDVKFAPFLLGRGEQRDAVA